MFVILNAHHSYIFFAFACAVIKYLICSYILVSVYVYLPVLATNAICEGTKFLSHVWMF